MDRVSPQTWLTESYELVRRRLDTHISHLTGELAQATNSLPQASINNETPSRLTSVMFTKKTCTSDPGASMQLGQLPNPNGYSVSLSKQFHCSLYTHYSPTRKYILRWITAYKWRQSRVHCSNYPIGDFPPVIQEQNLRLRTPLRRIKFFKN